MHQRESRPAPLVLLLAMLLATLLGGCSGSGGGPARGGEPAGPRQVMTARPEAIAWTQTIELGGTLEAPERVEIAARIEGAVIGLEVDLGDTVERGDTLARITPEDFSARVAQADAELAQARVELERLEAMVSRELASEQQLEQARTRSRVAQAQRRLAGRQLADTRVIAPFDGAIAERLVSPGAFVRIGTPLFVLVATSPLRLAIDVPEAHARAVQVGTVCRVLHESGGALEARVTRVAPVVDPATRTFRALVEVPADASSAMRPGMFVRARIALGVLDDVVRVPRAAVFEVLGRARVALVVDGRIEPRDVELVGEEEGSAIVRGVGATHEVVVRSPGLLAPGTEVASAPAGDRAAAVEEAREGGGA